MTHKPPSINSSAREILVKRAYAAERLSKMQPLVDQVMRDIIGRSALLLTSALTKIIVTSRISGATDGGRAGQLITVSASSQESAFKPSKP